MLKKFAYALDLKESQRTIAFEIFLKKIVKFLSDNSALEVPNFGFIKVRKSKSYVEITAILLDEEKNQKKSGIQFIMPLDVADADDNSFNISINPKIANQNSEDIVEYEADELQRKIIEKHISDFLPKCKIILNYNLPKDITIKKISSWKDDVEESFFTENNDENLHVENNLEKEDGVLKSSMNINKEEQLNKASSGDLKQEDDAFLPISKNETLRKEPAFENPLNLNKETAKRNMQAKKEKISFIFWTVLSFAITIGIAAAIYFTNYEKIFFKENDKTQKKQKIETSENSKPKEQEKRVEQSKLDVAQKNESNSQTNLDSEKKNSQNSGGDISQTQNKDKSSTDKNSQKETKASSSDVTAQSGNENRQLAVQTKKQTEQSQAKKNNVDIEIKPPDANDKFIEGTIAYNGSYYSYQIASIAKNKEAAVKEALKAKYIGFEVFILEYYNKGILYYRVRLGPFYSLSEAREIEKKYKTAVQRK